MTIYDFYKNKANGRWAKGLIIVVMNSMMVLCVGLWTATSILIFPLALVFMKFVQGYSVRLLTRKCIWIYGRVWQFFFALFVIFQKIDCHRDKFKDPGIIVVNHRSFFDTYCMNMFPVYDVCLAVRAWPFRILFYGLFMKLAGYINIERFPWDRISQIADENCTGNSFVLFFPEGHRSRNKELTRFHSGAFKLAIENNVPLIPVCLTGTEELLPPGRHYLAPAKIKMKVLDSVWPDQFGGKMAHLELKKHVRHLMGVCIEEMDAT